jgi:predicted nucleotidyltransferase
LIRNNIEKSDFNRSLKETGNMKEHDYKILSELKESVSRKVRVSDMRLFGSRARGDSDEFSDFDVFIETETIDKKIRKLKQAETTVKS